MKQCPSSGVSWFEVSGGGVGERYCGWLVVINSGLGLAVIFVVLLFVLLVTVGLQLGVDDLE